MFAVDHAATALLIKRRFPSVSLTPILLSVQAMELAWVGLNYLGIERTTTEASVRSVADIHLAHMPFSHSVATSVGGALLAWLLLEKGLGRPDGSSRCSRHRLASRARSDDARSRHRAAASTFPSLGLGLYNHVPMWGFALELVYGVACGAGTDPCNPGSHPRARDACAAPRNCGGKLGTTRPPCLIASGTTSPVTEPSLP
jgi:hypothetical protein